MCARARQPTHSVKSVRLTPESARDRFPTPMRHKSIACLIPLSHQTAHPTLLPMCTSDWPPPYGIIRTPYSRWIQLAHQADYHIGLLPIAPDHAKAFDETKFWAWFKGTMEGQPYGFHNFIYSFLDTADPMANLPKPFDDAVATWLVSFLDRLLGDSGEVNMYSIFTAALNQRLKTNCRTMDCIFPVLLAKNLTLGEATAIPEQDEWKYDDGKNFSRYEIVVYV